MEEIYKNIYRIPVALPGNPLKELNAYLVRGEGRPLLIDTGFSDEASRRSLFEGLDALSVDASDLDVFLTHFHADHAGLVDVLKNEKNKIFISEADSRAIANELREDHWDYVQRQSLLMGFSSAEELDYKEHPAYLNRAKKAVPCDFLQEGDRLSYGGYNFSVLELKGHTPGHLGLYEKEHELFFAGDHILDRITPNICCWDLDHDYLGSFLKNLDRVKALRIQRLFPGHRALIGDPGKRIEELHAHHARRLESVRRILADKPSTAYECSSLIKWDFLGGYFLDFPAPQKWFASSEMLAHLQHLYLNGEAERESSEEGYLVYGVRCSASGTPAV